MTARGAVLTPFLHSPVELSGDGALRLWWHKLLPVGSINYKGRRLNFTRKYNDDLAAAFQQQAYDQVPLQLADSQNTHTNDPERFRGDVVAMRSTGDGLFIGISPTDDGERVLEKNPRLGVSARIVEGYERADGKFFPAAIQHVLATLDPRIPGLGAWRAIEASNDPIVTIDLTGEAFAGEEKGAGAMPELTADQQAKLARLLDLPEAQFAQLVAGLPAVPDLTDDEIAALAGNEVDDDELAELIAGLSEEELALLEADFQRETAATAGATGLSTEAALALEMANYRADENASQIQALMRKADKDAYELERRKLVHDLGIAPSVVEAARPLLEGAGHTVELSNGNIVDGGQVMRRVLDEVGKIGRMLDFGQELGTPLDADGGNAETVSRRTDVVSLFRAQTGL
jgi:hypothetical protein